MKTIALPWTTVGTVNANEEALPATGWMRAGDITKVRASFELRGVTGVLNVCVGYQTANAENSPDAHVTLGTLQTANNVYYGASFADIAANTAGKQFIRFVWVVKLTSGSTLSIGRVGGSIDILTP